MTFLSTLLGTLVVTVGVGTVGLVFWLKSPPLRGYVQNIMAVLLIVLTGAIVHLVTVSEQPGRIWIGICICLYIPGLVKAHELGTNRRDKIVKHQVVRRLAERYVE